MKKNKWFVSLALIALCSCSTETLEEKSVLFFENQPDKNLNHWIDTHFTQPYNIAVRYSQSQQHDGQRYAYPPKIEKVKPVLELLKALWIDLYANTRIGGVNFFKQNAPIEIVLHGGKNLSDDNVEIISNKVSGLIIHLYNIDEFEKTNKLSGFKILRMLHHQFFKQLIDKKSFDKTEFSNLNTYGYSNWQSDPLKRNKNIFELSTMAFASGFYSLPAQENVLDDLSETVSVLLCTSSTEIDNVFKQVTFYDKNAETASIDKERVEKIGKTLAGKKEFVQNYFSKKWLLNFNRIQVLSITLINNYFKPQQ